MTEKLLDEIAMIIGKISVDIDNEKEKEKTGCLWNYREL